MLYLITKLQNLKAIHNPALGELKWFKLYLITKLQNLKAIHNELVFDIGTRVLYLITKLQNLKAIHNVNRSSMTSTLVVSNYKI